MMKKLLFALMALLTLASCAEKKPAIPLYGWDSIGKNPNLEEVRAKFQNYKAHGFTGICVQADLADLPAISASASRRTSPTSRPFRPSPMRKASSTTPGSLACCKATSRTTGTA